MELEIVPAALDILLSYKGGDVFKIEQLEISSSQPCSDARSVTSASGDESSAVSGFFCPFSSYLNKISCFDFSHSDMTPTQNLNFAVSHSYWCFEFHLL